jgi:membrane-associated protein
MSTFIDLFLHLDTHLAELVGTYGPWVYGILFLIVFAETGLVVTPFLPGDSLLFAVGAMGAVGALDARIAAILLIIAAVLGDAVNYAVGRFIGPRVFKATAGEGFLDRALNREHLARAHTFFEKYGGKAVVLGRFVPIVRTFVPFVAGAGSMDYPKFALYNVLGALAWVGVCLGAGYAFGNVPIVSENFTLVALGIVAVSLLPVVFEVMGARRRARAVEPSP